jgi:hypothetical protein
MKAHALTESCIQLFLLVLLILAKKWKQPKCTLTDEWRDKTWYIHVRKYYSTVKSNKIVMCGMNGS